MPPLTSPERKRLQALAQGLSFDAEEFVEFCEFRDREFLRVRVDDLQDTLDQIKQLVAERPV